MIDPDKTRIRNDANYCINNGANNPDLFDFLKKRRHYSVLVGNTNYSFRIVTEKRLLERSPVKLINLTNYLKVFATTKLKISYSYGLGTSGIKDTYPDAAITSGKIYQTPKPASSFDSV